MHWLLFSPIPLKRANDEPDRNQDPRRRIYCDHKTQIHSRQSTGAAGVVLVLQPSQVDEADQVFAFSSWRFLRESLRVFGFASAAELDTADVRLSTGRQPYMFSSRRWEVPLIEALYGNCDHLDDMDHGLHGVLLPGCKIYGKVANVAGLDTGHRPPFVVSQVFQRLRAGTPRIPDHCGAGVCFVSRIRRRRTGSAISTACVVSI